MKNNLVGIIIGLFCLTTNQNAEYYCKSIGGGKTTYENVHLVIELNDSTSNLAVVHISSQETAVEYTQWEIAPELRTRVISTPTGPVEQSYIVYVEQATVRTVTVALSGAIPAARFKADANESYEMRLADSLGQNLSIVFVTDPNVEGNAKIFVAPVRGSRVYASDCTKI